MKEEKAKQLLKRVREEDPLKLKYSIEEVKARIGWWSTWRLIRSWGPKAKGKRAFFEVKRKGKKKYLDFISEVERRLMNIQDFDSSIDLPLAWKAMRLEGIKTEAGLKRHGLFFGLIFTLISILLGLVVTYFIFK